MPVGYDLGDTIDGRRHHRHAQHHRLEHDAPERFGVGSVHENVRTADEVRHIGAETQHANVISNPEVTSQIEHVTDVLRIPVQAADDDQVGRVSPGNHLLKRADRQLLSFPLLNVPDVEQDRGRRGDTSDLSKTSSCGGAVRRSSRNGHSVVDDVGPPSPQERCDGAGGGLGHSDDRVSKAQEPDLAPVAATSHLSHVADRGKASDLGGDQGVLGDAARTVCVDEVEALVSE